MYSATQADDMDRIQTKTHAPRRGIVTGRDTTHYTIAELIAGVTKQALELFKFMWHNGGNLEDVISLGRCQHEELYVGSPLALLKLAIHLRIALLHRLHQHESFRLH
jgi:hypothetical protein